MTLTHAESDQEVDFVFLTMATVHVTPSQRHNQPNVISIISIIITTTINTTKTTTTTAATATTTRTTLSKS